MSREHEAAVVQRSFRGFRARKAIMQRELGVQRLYSSDDPQSEGVRLIRMLQLHSALSSAPAARCDATIEMVGGIFADLEQHLPEDDRFFCRKHEDARQQLFRHARIVAKGKGSYLFQQGDASNDTFYFVVSGRVAVVVEDLGGQAGGEPKAELGVGSTFGENAFGTAPDTAAGQQRAAGILCQSDCLFATVTRAAYLRLSGELAEHVVAALKTHPHERSDAQVRLAMEHFSESDFFEAQLKAFSSRREFVCRSCTHVRIRSNELLFRQGDAADSFYLVVAGFVRVVVDGKPANSSLQS